MASPRSYPHAAGTFEEFDLEADAWDWLDAEGFVQRTENHREFDHPDGRHAIVLHPDEDGTTEVKIFEAGEGEPRL